MTTGPTIRLGWEDPAAQYLDYVRPRFLELGYSWDVDIGSDYLEASCVAELRRTRIVALNVSQIIFVFTTMRTLTPPILQEYVAGCEQFARVQRPAAAGLGCCLIPVVVAFHLPADTRSTLLEAFPRTPRPGKQSLLPVAYVLDEASLVYSERRRALHAVVWRPLQRIIQMMLLP